MSYFGAEDYGKAIHSYEQFLKTVDPNNKSVTTFLAESYAERGDFENAIRWQEKAIGLSGGNAKDPPLQLL